MLRRKRILLVEDDPDTVETMMMILGDVEFDVDCALNGDQAIKVATEKLPDVVLLDIGLQGINGFEIAGKLRQVDGLSDCVIICVSGYVNESYFRVAKNMGMDAYIAKPYEVEELLSCIRTHLDDGNSFRANVEDWSTEVMLKAEETNSRLRVLSARSREVVRRAREICSQIRNMSPRVQR